MDSVKHLDFDRGDVVFDDEKYFIFKKDAKVDTGANAPVDFMFMALPVLFESLRASFPRKEDAISVLNVLMASLGQTRRRVAADTWEVEEEKKSSIYIP